MKKILLLILLIVFLSGCTMEYNVTFRKDGIINDNLYVEELLEWFAETEPDDWGELVATRIHSINIRNEFFEELATYEISLKNNYSDFKTFSNEKFVKKYAGDITISDGDESTLMVKFSDALKYNLYGSDDIAPYIESLKINVTFPYDVVKSNATSVKDNIYTWELSEKSKLDNIFITYKTPKTTDKTSEKTVDILIILIVVLLAVFIFIIRSKNKKNNAL